MPYVVKKPLKCDGVRCKIGDPAPRLSAEEKRKLIEAGVIQNVARDEPEDEAPQPKPTKKELQAKAEALGLEVPARATVDELTALIEAAEADAEKPAGSEGLPPGIDPTLQGVAPENATELRGVNSPHYSQERTKQ